MMENLGLMQGLTELLRRIPVRYMTIAEISHMEYLDELMAEISKLVDAVVKNKEHRNPQAAS